MHAESERKKLLSLLQQELEDLIESGTAKYPEERESLESDNHPIVEKSDESSEEELPKKTRFKSMNSFVPTKRNELTKTQARTITNSTTEADLYEIILKGSHLDKEYEPTLKKEYQAAPEKNETKVDLTNGFEQFQQVMINSFSEYDTPSTWSKNLSGIWITPKSHIVLDILIRVILPSYEINYQHLLVPRKEVFLTPKNKQNENVYSYFSLVLMYAEDVDKLNQVIEFVLKAMHEELQTKSVLSKENIFKLHGKMVLNVFLAILKYCERIGHIPELFKDHLLKSIAIYLATNPSVATEIKASLQTLGNPVPEVKQSKSTNSYAETIDILKNINLISKVLADVRGKFYTRDSSINNLVRKDRTLGFKSSADFYCQVFVKEVPLEKIADINLFIKPYKKIYQTRHNDYKFSYFSIILLYSQAKYKANVFKLIQKVLLRLDAEVLKDASKTLLIYEDLQNNNSKSLFQCILEYFIRISVYPQQIKVRLNPMIRSYLEKIEDQAEIKILNELLDKVENIKSEEIEEVEEVRPVTLSYEDKQRGGIKRRLSTEKGSKKTKHKRRKIQEVTSSDENEYIEASSSSTTTTTTTTLPDVETRKAPRYSSASSSKTTINGIGNKRPRGPQEWYDLFNICVPAELSSTYYGQSPREVDNNEEEEKTISLDSFDEEIMQQNAEVSDKTPSINKGSANNVDQQSLRGMNFIGEEVQSTQTQFLASSAGFNFSKESIQQLNIQSEDICPGQFITSSNAQNAHYKI